MIARESLTIPINGLISPFSALFNRKMRSQSGFLNLQGEIVRRWCRGTRNTVPDRGVRRCGEANKCRQFARTSSPQQISGLSSRLQPSSFTSLRVILDPFSVHLNTLAIQKYTSTLLQNDDSSFFQCRVRRHFHRRGH